MGIRNEDHITLYSRFDFKMGKIPYFPEDNGQVLGYQLSIFAQAIVTLSWNYKFGNYNAD